MRANTAALTSRAASRVIAGVPLLTQRERVGTTVLGKYHLRRVLGEGGMGVVFEGEHLKLRRPVAVKFLLPALASDATVVTRFLNEARTASKLRHPNVVDVLDIDSAEDGAPFMVMELLEGESLTARMEGKRMSPAEALSVLEPAMEALALAHEQGIVHRDLKPDNIFLHRVGDREIPKVLDFGIAKILQEGATPLTQSGAVLGTIAYMPPEQAGGKNVGPWSDVWSMGVILYEALSGRLPIEFDPNAPLTAHLVKLVVDRPTPLAQAAPHLSVDLTNAIDSTLQHDVNERFQSMRALLNVMRQVMREEPAPVRSQPLAVTPPVEASLEPHPLEPHPLEPHPLEDPPQLPTQYGFGLVALGLVLAVGVVIASIGAAMYLTDGEGEPGSAQGAP